MTDLYYGGTEIPGWRKLLTQSGISHVALSYMGLRRRTKFTRPWRITDKYPAHQKIFLDSGTYTLKKDNDKYTDEELRAFADHYYTWAADNADRLEIISEFDALQLGTEWIAAQREKWAPIFGDKFLVVWHPEHGLSEATLLASRYRRLGVLQTHLGAQDLTAFLNGLVRQHGTLLHGMAMTKPDVIKAVRFASVASTSWLSPSQYGDTIIHVGGQLKRYPVKYKAKSRSRHFRQIEQAGFDAQKILDDDPTEVLRLAIWSWERTMQQLNTGRVVTAHPETPPAHNTEQAEEPVEMQAPETRNSIRPRGDRIQLPFLSRKLQTETYTDENGVRQEREVSVLGTSGRALVHCNSCYINSVCDAFEPDTECKYDIPVSLRTRTERQAADDTVEEILLERFLRGVLYEQVNGGYVDANVSAEADRLIRFKKLRAEAEQDRFSVKIEASQRSGEMGMISRIFGQAEGEKARELEAPQPAADAMRSMGVVDAEIVEERFDA